MCTDLDQACNQRQRVRPWPVSPGMTAKTRIAAAAGGLLLAGCAQPGVPVAAPSAAPTTVTKTVTAKPAPSTTFEPIGEEGDPPECHVRHVSVAIQPGDSLGHGVFQTSITLTNRGPGPCTLYGSSPLELYTAKGAPLRIKEIRSEQGASLITVQKGRTAKLVFQYAAPYLDEPAGCLPAPTVAKLALPADEDERIDAKLADPANGLPAVCGPVTVAPWAGDR